MTSLPIPYLGNDFIFVTRTIFELHIFLVLTLLYPYWERYVNPPRDFITHTIFGQWFHLCDSYHIRVAHILGFSLHYPYWERYVNPISWLHYPYHIWAWFHLCDSYHIRVAHIMGLSLLYPYWERLCKSTSWLHYPYHIWADDFIFVTRTIFELHIFLVLAFSTHIENTM